MAKTINPYPNISPDPLGDGNYSQPSEFPIPEIGDMVLLVDFGIKPRTYVQHYKEDINRIGKITSVSEHWGLCGVEFEDGTGTAWVLASIIILKNKSTIPNLF